MVYALEYIELKMVKTDQLREKINFKGFHENDCYSNQAQPWEVLFDSTDDNNSSCSFTKQDLIFNQAYLKGFCLVLCNKVLTVSSGFQCFFQGLLS